MRAVAIILMLMQALAAQAGVAGIACTHFMIEGSAHSQVVDQIQNANASTETQKSPTHDRCCCDVVGHCSATAIGTIPVAANGHIMNPNHPLLLAGASITRGFTTTPYRPPSPAA